CARYRVSATTYWYFDLW
nr:immunoglobulin heavy chain junction region [Macaca mulatta]MOW91224.1 immunoglobulin heavy chain junction region [Macaca mulatta]MOW91859.1 immunoglobulin heavy chain junction region [Macaca mulatta]